MARWSNFAWFRVNSEAYGLLVQVNPTKTKNGTHHWLRRYDDKYAKKSA